MHKIYFGKVIFIVQKSLPPMPIFKLTLPITVCSLFLKKVKKIYSQKQTEIVQNQICCVIFSMKEWFDWNPVTLGLYLGILEKYLGILKWFCKQWC